MKAPRIEDDPAALAEFTKLARGGRTGAAAKMLATFTIDERTIRELAVPGLLDEVRVYAASYEHQLNRRILLGDVVRPAHVSTHPRAQYQLLHYDMLEDFSRALRALIDYNVHAKRDEVSVEFVAWAEGRLHESVMGERIATHLDLTPASKVRAA